MDIVISLTDEQYKYFFDVASVRGYVQSEVDPAEYLLRLEVEAIIERVKSIYMESYRQRLADSVLSLDTEAKESIELSIKNAVSARMAVLNNVLAEVKSP